LFSRVARDYVFPKRRKWLEPGILNPLEILLFPARLLRRLLRRLGRRRRRTREHLSQPVFKSKTVRFDGSGFHFTCHHFTTFLPASKAKTLVVLAVAGRLVGLGRLFCRQA